MNKKNTEKGNHNVNVSKKKQNRFKLIVFMSVVLVILIILAFVLKYKPQFLFDDSVYDKSKPNYTWDEYTKMSNDEQEQYRESFKSDDEFYEWLYSNSEEIVLYPWEMEGKVPSEYTWEEFEELSEDEKKVFKSCFVSEEEFILWKEKVHDVECPWENGGKKPSEYTWEEFEELTAGQQEKFFASFETEDELQKWLDKTEK